MFFGSASQSPVPLPFHPLLRRENDSANRVILKKILAINGQMAKFIPCIMMPLLSLLSVQCSIPLYGWNTLDIAKCTIRNVMPQRHSRCVTFSAEVFLFRTLWIKLFGSVVFNPQVYIFTNILYRVGLARFSSICVCVILLIFNIANIDLNLEEPWV